MNEYDPTVNPGDTRVRAHTINISNNLNGYPRVDIQEERVIKTKDGVERGLEGLGFFSVTIDPTELTTPYPVRDLATDQETGDTEFPAQLFQSFYSWVRSKQLARDAAAQAALPPVILPPAP
jgi:hypothetical protein